MRLVASPYRDKSGRIRALLAVTISEGKAETENQSITARKRPSGRTIFHFRRSIQFSTVCFTVGQDFDAKPRNSAQRSAKAKLRITWRQQRYAKQ
jgi:hypothetical protein